MKIVTRFNPSCSGPLHLGHLYTMLANERYAHEHGGKFAVRFDDTCSATLLQAGDRLEAIREGQQADIRWLGLTVDEWINQSDELPWVHKKWAEMHFTPLGGSLVEACSFRTSGKILAGFPPARWMDCTPYGYTPVLTPERVLMDWRMEVSHVIRGFDFAVEVAHYWHYCDFFGIPRPEQWVLPRLRSASGNVSKTLGGHTITEMRADGWKPRAVVELVEDAALFVPGQGWDLWNNLRPDPRLPL